MIRNSNFKFVYEHNPEENEELYDFLYKLESQVKIQPYEIGNTIRQVLEILCAKKILSYGLTDTILQAYKQKSPHGIPDLNYQLYFLSDKNNLPNLPNFKPLPSFNININEVSFEKLGPQDTKRFKYKKVFNFLRQIGNDYSHNCNPFSTCVFKKEYTNVLYAIKCLHKYVQEYFDLTNEDITPFNEDFMPIGNYEIVNSSQANDFLKTYSLKEFVANRYEDYHNDRVGYSVIRQYNRVNSNDVEFIRRASDVYLAGDNCGSLLKQISILSTKDSQYYIVAYDFRVTAQPINNAFLSSLSIKEKLELCLSYAEILNSFHNNSTPIYHRMLTSKCAYYADERDKRQKISTAIIKFEFAKIDNPTVQTILPYTINQKRGLSQSDQRFMPDELELPWNKADIFSLGVLFSDILMGKIGGYTIQEMRQNNNIRPYTDILLKTKTYTYDNVSEVCADLRTAIEKLHI